ncbi:hypothetical protein F443_22838 [Phytophthora nicotianae P1569]|uniref:Uncharacterized protein n=1 Tax=Phytophthora nicotianae P1569 TaxID=1317065 RepID=V9DVK2_PHYNI|nr:hypothetical protein F443_22838 [Phytophthora nicotianae P1569]
MSHDSSFIGYAVECSGTTIQSSVIRVFNLLNNKYITYAETELCVVKYARDRIKLA